MPDLTTYQLIPDVNLGAGIAVITVFILLQVYLCLAFLQLITDSDEGEESEDP